MVMSSCNLFISYWSASLSRKKIVNTVRKFVRQFYAEISDFWKHFLQWYIYFERIILVSVDNTPQSTVDVDVTVAVIVQASLDLIRC